MRAITCNSLVKTVIDSGVSLDKIATLLGYSNLNTTRSYTTLEFRILTMLLENWTGLKFSFKIGSHFELYSIDEKQHELELNFKYAFRYAFI